jgi:hypothetical protein
MMAIRRAPDTTSKNFADCCTISTAGTARPPRLGIYPRTIRVARNEREPDNGLVVIFPLYRVATRRPSEILDGYTRPFPSQVGQGRDGGVIK